MANIDNNEMKNKSCNSNINIQKCLNINNSVKLVNNNNNNNNNNYTQIGFYDIISTIGHGNFAVCKLAQHRLTKTLVAIKFIDKTNLDATHLSRIYKEIDIMKCVNHKNIIKLYQVMESKNMLYLVCEYATNGELYEYILRNGAMNEKRASEKFYQIINAVDYCHKRNIVHRDLKSENLLLDSNMNIKLADFGFANYYDMINPLKTFCGSAPYAAPEVFCGQKYYGPEIDVWSLGVILYVLVTGTLPFNSDSIQQLKQRVLACKYVLPGYLSSECVDLIQKILVVNAKDRYSLEQIKQHNWFKVNNISFNMNTISNGGSSQREKFIESRSNTSNFSISTSFESISENLSEISYTSSTSTSSSSSSSTTNKNDDYGLYDKNALNLMRSCGFDINETLLSLNQNLFNNNTAIYRFLTENKINDNLHETIINKLSSINNIYNNNSNDNTKLNKQTLLYPNTESNDVLNTNLIKRNDLLKTIKTHYNKLHKNFISNSSSVDEGVESDFSSPTQSFSNDFLSSVSPNTQLFLKQQQYQQQQQQQQQQQNLPHFQQQATTLTPTTPTTTTSPPLTPPPILRKTRMQTSNRSINSCGNKSKYIINSSNNSINSKKYFNPYDLRQIKCELKQLIKNNSESNPGIINTNNNNNNIKKNESQNNNNTNTSTTIINNNNNNNKKQFLINDRLIANSNKNEIKSNDNNNSKTISKSSINLFENCDNFINNKYNRKFSLK